MSRRPLKIKIVWPHPIPQELSFYITQAQIEEATTQFCPADGSEENQRIFQKSKSGNNKRISADFLSIFCQLLDAPL